MEAPGKPLRRVLRFRHLTGQLAQRTKDNSALRIFAAAGDNDLVTSYVTMKYMLEHSGIASEHLTINDYPGGHMMYLQVHRGREVAASLAAAAKRRHAPRMQAGYSNSLTIFIVTTPRGPERGRVMKPLHPAA